MHGGQAGTAGRPPGRAHDPYGYEELPLPALSLPEVLPSLEQASAASQHSSEPGRATHASASGDCHSAAPAALGRMSSKCQACMCEVSCKVEGGVRTLGLGHVPI